MTDLRLALFQSGYENLAGVPTTIQLPTGLWGVLLDSVCSLHGLGPRRAHLSPLLLPRTAKDQRQNTGTSIRASPGGCDGYCRQSCRRAPRLLAVHVGDNEHPLKCHIQLLQWSWGVKH